MRLTATAGGENPSIGGRASGMGSASLTLIDAFAAHNNQAAIGFIDQITFGLYSERRFLLDDIDYVSGSVLVPTGTGTFGLNVSYFGFELYNEKKVGLAFGKAFGEKFSAGLQFDYIGLQIAEYGSRSAYTFEAGLLYKVSDQLYMAAHIYNPMRIQIEDFQEETLPTIMKFGLSYRPSEKVIFAVETEKDIDFLPRFKAGIDYNVLQNFYLRAGFNTQPATYSFGMGLRLKNLDIDIASNVHPVLGLTPQLSVIYALEKK